MKVMIWGEMREDEEGKQKRKKIEKERELKRKDERICNKIKKGDSERG